MGSFEPLMLPAMGRHRHARTRSILPYFYRREKSSYCFLQGREIALLFFWQEDLPKWRVPKWQMQLRLNLNLPEWQEIFSSKKNRFSFDFWPMRDIIGHEFH